MRVLARTLVDNSIIDIVLLYELVYVTSIQYCAAVRSVLRTLLTTRKCVALQLPSLSHSDFRSALLCGCCSDHSRVDPILYIRFMVYASLYRNVRAERNFFRTKKEKT